MTHKVNIYELAKVTGFSTSTVSKALRDSYEIGEDTKKKVVTKARELGYSPNPYAGFLRNQKRNRWRSICPNYLLHEGLL